MPKDFHIGDVLSITTDRLLSPRHMEGVYDILNYMTGDDLFTHQLPRAANICKPALVEQFPQFDTPEFQIEVGELAEMLDSPSGEAETRQLIDGWLVKMAAKYGETFPVSPIRPADWEHIDPVDELKEMAGPEKVIVVEAV